MLDPLLPSFFISFKVLQNLKHESTSTSTWYCYTIVERLSEAGALSENSC